MTVRPYQIPENIPAQRVSGGVGSVTTAVLARHVIEAAEKTLL